MKRSASDGTVGPGNGVGMAGGGGPELKRQRSQAQVADPTWPLDKQHADSIINFLIRLACQVRRINRIFFILFFRSMIRSLLLPVGVVVGVVQCPRLIPPSSCQRDVCL